LCVFGLQNCPNDWRKNCPFDPADTDASAAGMQVRERKKMMHRKTCKKSNILIDRIASLSHLHPAYTMTDWDPFPFGAVFSCALMFCLGIFVTNVCSTKEYPAQRKAMFNKICLDDILSAYSSFRQQLSHS
jgi:hypothetical protein